MSLAAAKSADAPIVLPELLNLLPSAVAAAEQYAGEARAAVAARVSKGGKVDRVLIDDHQHAVHGFAWIATYVEVLRQLEAWAQRLNADGKFGEAEQIITQFVFGEYLAQLVGGVAMNQGEVARPNDFGLTDYAFSTLAKNKAVAALIASSTDALKGRLADLVRGGQRLKGSIAISGAFSSLARARMISC